MSRRKVDYVYVPKKKIKKVVIDAKRGRKSIEKTVNQKQILDGAYVRASAMKEFPNGKFEKGGKIDDKKYNFTVIEYKDAEEVMDDEPTGGDDFYGTKERVVDIQNQRAQRGYCIHFTISNNEGWYYESEDLNKLKKELEIQEDDDDDDDNEYAKGGQVKKAVTSTEYISKEEIKRFEDYVFEVYEEYGFTKPQVIQAVKKYINHLEPNTQQAFTWGGGDSLDRERVYEYLLDPKLNRIKNPTFAKGGVTKNFISVGDIVIDKKDNKFYIVYEVKNGAATKRFLLPREVAESIAFEQNPELIDWNKYTMYSDQALPTFSVGDMVYVEKHRKSGVIIGLGSRQNGEMYYTVKFANDTQDSVDDSELELISTYKRGGNIGSYNTGRSWTLDHNQHNKSESYEIPMDDRKFAKGGTIKNQYAGKTEKQVWEMWTPQQRKHFLGDHYQVGEYRPESIAAISEMTYDELRSKMATISGGALYTLEDHIMRGQYKRGGNIGSYNSGRSWKQDHNRHNKSESYEIPMGDRKFAKGGKIQYAEMPYLNFCAKHNIKLTDLPESIKRKIKIYDDKYDIFWELEESKEDNPNDPIEDMNYELSLMNSEIVRDIREYRTKNKKMAQGGEIPDLSNMNIDHLFANGGRTYPTTEEKIYS